MPYDTCKYCYISISIHMKKVIISFMLLIVALITIPSAFGKELPTTTTTSGSTGFNLFKDVGVLKSQVTGYPSSILLLNSEQICDNLPQKGLTDCATQIIYNTGPVLSVYTPERKEWAISGSFTNVNNIKFESAGLPNVEAQAIFFDKNGDQIGVKNGIKVTPNTIFKDEDGHFTFDVSDKDLGGNIPYFMVILYDMHPES
jgi:hypothetical protein